MFILNLKTCWLVNEEQVNMLSKSIEKNLRFVKLDN